VAIVQPGDAARQAQLEQEGRPYLLEYLFGAVGLNTVDILEYTKGTPRLVHWRCDRNCKKDPRRPDHEGYGLIGDAALFPEPWRAQFAEQRLKWWRKISTHFEHVKLKPQRNEVRQLAAHKESRGRLANLLGLLTLTSLLPFHVLCCALR